MRGVRFTDISTQPSKYMPPPVQLKRKRPWHSNTPLRRCQTATNRIIHIPNRETSDKNHGPPECEELHIFLDDGVDYTGFDDRAGFCAYDYDHDAEKDGVHNEFISDAVPDAESYHEGREKEAVDDSVLKGSVKCEDAVDDGCGRY